MPNRAAAQALLEYIQTHGFMTFAAMQRVLKHYMPVKGPMVIESVGYPNVMAWVGISWEWVETLERIREEAYQDPCSIDVYRLEGLILTLPLADMPLRTNYTTWHWLPLVTRMWNRRGTNPAALRWKSYHT